jgi:hypothetical protein
MLSENSLAVVCSFSFMGISGLGGMALEKSDSPTMQRAELLVATTRDELHEPITAAAGAKALLVVATGAKELATAIMADAVKR